LRLTPDVRRAQIVAAAGKVALELGYLPAPLDRLSREAGASNGLIYAYFPNQHALFNSLLAHHFGLLVAAGLEAACAEPSLLETARGCAQIYFDHIVEYGPIIHLILRDQFMVAHVNAANRGFRDRVMLRLARNSRRTLGLASKENVAAINLVTAIPEQAALLAWRGELERDRARDLMMELIASSLAAFQPGDGTTTMPV
jgi:AcrR family transcriptional regulator